MYPKPSPNPSSLWPQGLLTSKSCSWSPFLWLSKPGLLRPFRPSYATALAATYREKNAFTVSGGPIGSPSKGIALDGHLPLCTVQQQPRGLHLAVWELLAH